MRYTHKVIFIDGYHLRKKRRRENIIACILLGLALAVFIGGLALLTADDRAMLKCLEKHGSEVCHHELNQ